MDDNDNELDKIELPKFHLTELFPDAKSIFSLSLLPLEEVKEEVLIVLDTNSLIIPYTIHKKSLDEIKGTYQRLIKEQRLFIPAQVAREFARLKAKKIRELFQKTSLKQDIRSVKIEKYPLLESTDDYPKLLQLEKEINEKIDEYRKAIKPILNFIRSWKWNDPVSTIYKALFQPDIIVEGSLSPEEIEKDFSRRMTNKIPPGYKDGSKDDGGIGDIIIWNTILDLGREKKKPLIFVTGEEKPDWMLRSENEALYPRFELIDEYSRASSGNSFYILKFSELLDLFGVEEGVVEEVKKGEVDIQFSERILKENVNRTIKNDFLIFASGAERTIYEWLVKTCPSADIIESQSFPDYIVKFSPEIMIGVDVKANRSSSPTQWFFRLQDLSYRAYYEIKERGLTSLVFVVVFESEKTAIDAANLFRRRSLQMSGVDIVIGYLKDNDFNPILNEFPQVW